MIGRLIRALVTLGLYPFPGRRRLTANRTYYVRSDGNDSNTGLADTAGGAFASKQRAVDAIAMLDINGFRVAVQVRDGADAAGRVVLKNVVGFAGPGDLVIQGNAATPANVVAAPATGDCFLADGISTIWDIIDMKLSPAGGAGIVARAGATVRFGNCDFGATPGGAHLVSTSGATIQCLSNYVISGGAGQHFNGTYGAAILIPSGTSIVLAGTPTFATFAYAGIANIQAYGLTFTGAATGKRFDVFGNGVIFTNNAGANYLPGDAAGTEASGGRYI